MDTTTSTVDPQIRKIRIGDLVQQENSTAIGIVTKEHNNGMLTVIWCRTEETSLMEVKKLKIVCECPIPIEGLSTCKETLDDSWGQSKIHSV